VIEVTITIGLDPKGEPQTADAAVSEVSAAVGKRSATERATT
jgi:hypothetical protein